MITNCKAIFVMIGAKVTGKVNFTQEKADGPTRIIGEIKGLTPGKHGFHVHEFADLSEGCKSGGAHFNPTGMTHGCREDDNRHIGDLVGNVEAESNDVPNIDFNDRLFTLNRPYSMIGRAMVVHDLEDELGRKDNDESKKTRSSGARSACGIIGTYC